MIADHPTHSLYPTGTRGACHALTSQPASAANCSSHPRQLYSNSCRPERSEGSAFLPILATCHSPLATKSFTIRTYGKFSRNSFRSNTYKKRRGWGSWWHRLQPVLLTPARHSARVRMNINPRHLRFLCFHTLTHSFALSKTLSPIVSCPSALFAQNTRGGVPPLSSYRPAKYSYPANARTAVVSSPSQT